MPITAALIGAGGSILGGAASGGLFGGGGSSGPGQADLTFFNAINKQQLLQGNETFGIPALNPSTPFSALNPGTGEVNIDPLARSLQLDSLSGFQGALGDSRSALLGNQNAFERARVNPLLERLAISRGARERDLSRTGVRGTFRDRSLLDFDIAGERALGDARSIAANDTLNAVNTLDKLLFNAGTGTGTNIFNQELKQLGLGIDTIKTINTLAQNLTVGAGSIAQASASNQALVDQAQLENLTAGIGAGLSTFGNAFNAPIQEGPTNPPLVGLNQ